MQTPPHSAPSIPPDYAPLGLRLDGTAKGPGFAASTLPDGSVMTEFSAGNPAYPAPFGPIYPTVYEGIPPWDMQTLANVATYGYDPLQEEVFDRAYESALARAARGLSPFWTDADPQTGMNYTPHLQYRQTP